MSKEKGKWLYIGDYVVCSECLRTIASPKRTDQFKLPTICLGCNTEMENGEKEIKNNTQIEIWLEKENKNGS